MVGAGHDRQAAGLFDAGCDHFGIGRNCYPAMLCGLRTPHHVDDHRQAGNVGERLAGQPGRRHAGGNEDKDVAVRHGFGARSVRWKTGRGLAGLYGLPWVGQTSYLCAAIDRCGLCGPRHTAHGAWRPMDSFEMNKIMGAVLGACLAILSINIAAGAIFAPQKPAKPGLRDRGARARDRRGARQAGRAGGADRGASGQGRGRPRARPPPRSAPPATPSTRAESRWSVPTCGASSAARRRRRRASTIRPR